MRRRGHRSDADGIGIEWVHTGECPQPVRAQTATVPTAATQETTMDEPVPEGTYLPQAATVSQRIRERDSGTGAAIGRTSPTAG